MQKRDLVTIRPLAATDHGFVFVSWLKNLRYSNNWFEQIDHDTYFRQYHKVIETILERPTISASVACLREDPDVTLGYSVVEGRTLHWVYVKPQWRRIGLARDLVPADIDTVTHLTRLGLILKPREVIFNPFL